MIWQIQFQERKYIMSNSMCFLLYRRRGSEAEMPRAAWRKSDIIYAVEDYVRNTRKLDFSITLLSNLPATVLKSQFLYLSKICYQSSADRVVKLYQLDTRKINELTDEDIFQLLIDSKYRISEIEMHNIMF